MPLPLIFGIGLVVAEVSGAAKMKEAMSTMEELKKRDERNRRRLEEQQKITNRDIEKVSKLKTEIIASFQKFTDIFEKIKNPPTFRAYSKNGVSIPRYDGCKMEDIYDNALSYIRRSICIAVSGPCHLYATSHYLSEKADEAREQLDRAEGQINKICDYCRDLSAIAIRYLDSLSKVNHSYIKHLTVLREIVIDKGKTDYINDFTYYDQLMLNNTVSLVGILYEMCKISLVIPADNEDEFSTINYNDIEEKIDNADIFLSDIT